MLTLNAEPTTVPAVQDDQTETPSPRKATALGWARPRGADLALIVVVLAIGVRVQWWLHHRPLWLDEQMIALNIRESSFFGLTGRLEAHQAAPLGWLWAQWTAVQVGGDGERVLRLIPMLGGAGAIVLAWLIGRRWLGTVGTLTLVGLCGFAPQFLNYGDQVKQYSGDTFWVLALIGLAAWALDSPQPLHRSYVWWGAAALAQWFSMAAILVTPGLALVLLVAVWRRGGWREARASFFAALGALAAVGAHYALSLRFVVGDPFFQEYWRDGFAPRSPSSGDVLHWLSSRLPALAEDPIGTPNPALFWPLVLAGLAVVVAYRRDLGMLVAAPLVTAIGLALLRVVPLSARLALWVVPVVFLLVAAALGASGRLATHWARRAFETRADWRRWVPRAVAAVLALAVMVPSAMGGWTLVREMADEVPPRPPRIAATDDRAGMRWLVKQQRPGDLVLVLQFGEPAALWYAKRRSEGVYRTVFNARPGDDCDPRALERALAGHKRVLFYAGARHSRLSPAVVLARLAQRGKVTESLAWGASVGVVLDLAGGPTRYSPWAPALTKDPATCIRLGDVRWP